MVTPRFYRDPLSANAEVQRFNEEYFTGADTRIYFGDIWVDEITALSFQMHEQTAPIYGYASYTWDAVATGNRSIQGSFRINFKEAYYLHAVLNQIEGRLDRGEGYRAPGMREGFYNDDITTMLPGLTVEHLLHQAENSTDKDFEDLAFEFEKTLWGASSSAAFRKATEERSLYPWFAGRGRDDLQHRGFNILITYGPYAEQYTPKQDGLSPSTAHSLVGVHITGVSQIVDTNGNPIQEEYSFIAKDLDQNINKGLVIPTE